MFIRPPESAAGCFKFILQTPFVHFNTQAGVCTEGDVVIKPVYMPLMLAPCGNHSRTQSEICTGSMLSDSNDLHRNKLQSDISLCNIVLRIMELATFDL